MGDDGVFCGNCGRELDVPSDVAPDQREACPVCGSKIREFRDSGTVSIHISAPQASAVASAPSAEVKDVRADRTPEADTIRGSYEATLQWHVLEGGLWWLQVLNKNGEIIDGGVGDNTEDALLEVYERLIPPS